MNIKIFLTIVLCSCIILVVLFLQWQLPEKNNQSLKIGALLSLSGDAAYYGVSELQAVQMAVDEVNLSGGIDGKRIELVIEDIGTLDNKKALGALKKLIDIDHVQAIVGPTWDMPAVTQVADQQQVVMISADNTEGVEFEQNYDYFYSTFYPQTAQMERLVEFAKQKEFKNVVIMCDNDIFSQILTYGFINANKNQILTVIEKFEVLPGTKDFRTQLLKIKELKPDAIVTMFANEISRGPLLTQMHELKINAPVLNEAGIENQDLLDNYGDYAEGEIFYTFPKTTPTQQDFLKRFQERYHQPPTGPAAPSAYDAANLIIEAFKQGARTAEEIKQILDNQEFESVTFGKLKFNQKGFVESEAVEIVIKTVRGGEFVEVE